MAGANATVMPDPAANDRQSNFMEYPFVKNFDRVFNRVAHNVEIGNSSVVAAQTGISGSTKVGKGVMIGGQAGIVGHINIGDGARINAQSGVSKSVEPGKAVTGSPAYDYTSSLRSQAISRNLPALEKRIKELEAIVKQLMSEKV